MVVYNLKLNQFLSPQLFILFHIFLITSLFSQLTQFSSAISFNYTFFSDNDPNITCELSAQAKDQVILLTTKLQPGQATVGRAMYFKPLHLWDEASGNLTDFTTHFTFVIKSQNEAHYADGLAFFLAPHDEQLPPVNKGGGMGLTFYEQERTPGVNHFVAAEFDVYNNKCWDPTGVNEHVGIDIKSMISTSYLPWPNNATIAITQGQTNKAWISYNSSSHNLSVGFTVFNPGSRGYKSNLLYQIVDLRKSLPELVTFGFSAATGNTTTHTLNSWDFSSSLEDVNINNTKDKKNSTLKLVVGFSVGGGIFVFIGGLALVLFVLRKRNMKDKEDDHILDDYIDEEFEKGIGPKKFSYNELARVTNTFNDKHMLGQGGFGGL